MFRVTTFGESHGGGVGCVVDGCPPRLPLAAADIQGDLARRRPGRSRYVTQRQEADEVEILSGVFEGKTLGSPIAMLIRNTDAKPKDYENLRDVFRPGHADFTYAKKYGIRDHRGGGRSSARETAARVAAGAVARKLLAAECGATIRGRLAQMDDIHLPAQNWQATEENPFFAATNDDDLINKLKERITALRRAGDSCGALVEVAADGVPAGWGAPVFGRLDADLAAALMSINAVKGAEIGAGFAAVMMRGSENNDIMQDGAFQSNNAGGVLGGISTGAQIVARCAVKPTSSIVRPQPAAAADGENTTVSTTGRHDPCVGIRAVPVAEAMVALVLADHFLRHRAQCG